MRVLHWFRADLRLDDNTALAVASERAETAVLAFVLEPGLMRSQRAGAPRVRFLLESLAALRADLARRGQVLVVRGGAASDVIPRLAREHHVSLVTWNRSDSPFARHRDAAVEAALAKDGVGVLSCKDDVVFGSDEVRSTSGGPYSVYTPYRNAWHARLSRDPQPPQTMPRLPPPVPGIEPGAMPTASELGFGDDPTQLPPAGEAAARRRLEEFLAGPVADYARDRDFPALDGTSRLSPYLRFGAISIRTCVYAGLDLARAERRAAAGARKWVDELVWREFYHAVLAENPHVLRGSYRREYDAIRWNDDAPALAAWCEGRTGYPIVDAGMRQLATTGWMHNRARMIVASFLTKDLLLDWRLGEAHFQRRLVDGEPANNNGGWQWAASTGTDAQPYFRIFNPVSQGRKFDADGEYVRRFVPELRKVDVRFIHAPWESPSPPRDYPPPIVSHAERRILALQRYEAARAGAKPAARPGAGRAPAPRPGAPRR